MKKETKVIIMLLLLQLFVIQLLCAQSIPAFPGAEGAGAYASGGRDGDIYFVTNLDDDGPGSLRYGFDTSPPEGRTILFKVSGTIWHKTGLQINKENITFAGQSAPGDGICIAGKSTYIGKRPPRTTGEFLGNNIIMRHLRFRLSLDASEANEVATDDVDTIWINSGDNILLDHLSTSWTSDEVLSASRDVKRLTVQYTLMTEPLNDYGHGFGSIIGASYPLTFHGIITYMLTAPVVILVQVQTLRTKVLTLI